MASNPKHDEDDTTGRFAYEGLDRVLHEKARLGIMTSLITKADGLLFGELKDLCALTDGNLSRHIDVLSDAGMVRVWKGYEGRRPQTLVQITADGRKHFLAYLAELERVLKDVQLRDTAEGTNKQARLPPGFVPVEE
ncbi:transcriptional regulator [candidate division BRC1 bacterium HGW-BRC1-1]|jgi:DNA-binding MarR family transcriptional regulator|nr:MAG: transcriptional regulator [candidate division BRC1 bacterium HGW-BRC1-1]